MSPPESSPAPSASPRLPEHHAADVVDVAEAGRVLECAQVERQQRFQQLVRHYLAQMLHGCTSAYCTAPTCLSCQKRHASRPVRPPTQLTARALAHYLAGQDNPHRGLCPHALSVEPQSLEIDGARGSSSHQGRRGEWHHGVYPSPSTVTQIVDAVKKQHQARKDTKSLSQNLFDSVTMIYAYSKQIPSSASLLHTLRSTSPQLSNTAPTPDATDPEAQTPARHRSPHVPAATRANGETGTLRVPSTAAIDRQPSRLNLRAQNHAHAASISSELLNDGRQVHRIPFQPRDPASAVKSPKRTERTSSHGNPEPPDISARKTRKKLHEKDAATVTSPPSSPIQSQRTTRAPKPTVSSDSKLTVLSTLNCSTLENLKDHVYDHRQDQPLDTFNFTVDYDTNRPFRPSTPFANRSLFYALGDSETLLKSFRDDNKAFAESPLPHLDSARMVHSFRDWNRHNGALVFDSLWTSLTTLFTPPKELQVQKSPRLTSSRKGATKRSSAERSSSDDATHRCLSNLEAAHIVIVCIHALTSLVSVGWPHTWAQLRKLRSWGVVIPDAASTTDDFMHPYLNMIDELEYEPAVRLAEQLLRAIGARTCHEHILEVTKKQREHHEDVKLPDTLMDIVVQHLVVVERVATASKRRLTPINDTNEDPGWTVTATLMEWLKTIITKKWDSKVEVNKWSAVGASIMLLDKLHMTTHKLNLHERMFEIPFLNERIDTVEEPRMFMGWEEQPNILHILQFPALIPAECSVRYFRTINFTTMMTQYEHTTHRQHMYAQLDKFVRKPHNQDIRNRMQVSMTDYLVLNVRREDPLHDTLHQLWGLERRMLLKPLKVKMGQHEGEVGADHGGVTYEFFRVVLSEAFNPDYGMFTVHPQTRMIWFQPSSLEPDWKFEMIGMLFSLAIYNGITLPVTFPLALYRHMLPEHAPLRNRDVPLTATDSINEGWPDLAKGFEQLLSWTDGDVADVFMRDYAFSYEAFGQNIDHNMEEPYLHPRQENSGCPAIRPEDLLSHKTSEAKPVTNANREAFVLDYIDHLTRLSVLPALQAFKKGFGACIQPKSLTLFSPYTLRSLVEGTQYISIPLLQRCARYERGYTESHPTIVNFWHVAAAFDQDDCRHLLEFVTASDRVPVTGYEGITFHIERVSDTRLLPTSSTCFGKLYLPDYENEAVLRGKLELAIRNSRGFGVV